MLKANALYLKWAEVFLEKDAFDDERFKISPSLPALEMPSAHAVAEKSGLTPWVMRALKSLTPFFRAQDTTHVLSIPRWTSEAHNLELI